MPRQFLTSPLLSEIIIAANIATAVPNPKPPITPATHNRIRLFVIDSNIKVNATAKADKITGIIYLILSMSLPIIGRVTLVILHNQSLLMIS